LGIDRKTLYDKIKRYGIESRWRKDGMVEWWNNGV